MMQPTSIGLICTTVAAAILVVVVAVLATRGTHPPKHDTKPRTTPVPAPAPLMATTAPNNGSIAVVGCGLAAAAFVHALRWPSKARVVVFEGDNRVGGRTLSTTQPLVPVSTQTPMREFAAWIFIPGRHSYTTTLLDELGVSTIPVTLLTPQSFRWSAELGRQPFGSLPPCDRTTTLSACSPTPADDALWFAHTGVNPALVPSALAAYVADLDLPAVAQTPSGFGWQDVVLRGVGRRQVYYSRVLNRVEPQQAGGVRLYFASGDVESADRVVLTLPPHRLLQVQGLPEAARALIARSFTTLSVGVLYLAWTGAAAWWGPQLGCVATTLPIGRVFFLSATDVRCAMCGADAVSFWNNLLVGSGPEAAAQEVARQLSTVFGPTASTPPANVAFRGWMDAVSLLTTLDGGTLEALKRPWGTDVPVWWASSDVSSKPGWVEGAVEIGTLTAHAFTAQR